MNLGYQSNTLSTLLQHPPQNQYRRTARCFLAFVNKPLHLVTLADIQGWQLSLDSLSSSSQRTALAAIKSLLSFGHKIGVLENNVGNSMRSPKAQDCLNERILSPDEVASMIREEVNQRNRLILLLLYSAGLRVSELCCLKWKDVKQRGESGQVTVLGKGQKTRTVLLPALVWNEIYSIRGDADASSPCFNLGKATIRGSILTVPKFIGLCQQLLFALAFRGRSAPTGCVTPTPRTVSTGALRFILCRRR
jgi:integrase/recombinase XerD